MRFAWRDIEANIPDPKLVVLNCKKDNGAQSPLGTVTDYLIARRIPVVFGQFENADLARLAPASKNAIALWSTLGNAAALRPPTSGASKYGWFFQDDLGSLLPGFQAAVDRAIVIPPVPRKADTILDVAVLHDGTPEALSLAEAIGNGVKIAGESLSNRSAHFVLSTTSDFATLLASNPDIIIGIGGDSVATSVRVIEASLATKKPIWVFSSRLRYNQGGTFNQALTTSDAKPTLRSRVIGVDYGGDRARLANLSIRYKETQPYLRSFDLLYDASYAVAFSAVHARRRLGNDLRALTPDDMIAGLQVLVPTSADPQELAAVGSTSANFIDALNNASSGTPFRLVGNSGKWVIDPGEQSRKNQETTFFCLNESNLLETYLPGNDWSVCAQYARPQ